MEPGEIPIIISELWEHSCSSLRHLENNATKFDQIFKETSDFEAKIQISFFIILI